MSSSSKPDISTSAAPGRSWAFTLPLSGQGVSQLPHDSGNLPGKSFAFHGTRIHPRRPGSNEGEVPIWFWLAFLGVGTLALSFICWGAFRSVSEEKFLRLTDAGPTLGRVGTKVASSGSGESEARQKAVRLASRETQVPPAVEVPPPLPVTPPPPPPLPMAELPSIELPPSPPGLLLPPPVSVPAVPVPIEATQPVVNLEQVKETDSYPLVFTHALPSEDTPMLRNWKMLGLYALTVVTLAQPAPVVAGDDQKTLLNRFDKLEKSIVESFQNLGSDIKSLNSELAIYKKELVKLQGDITGLQTDTLDNKLKINGISGKFESLEKQVGKVLADMDAIRRRLDTQPAPVATPSLDKATLEELKSQLLAIEKAILTLQPPATASRVALSPGAAATATTGRVMLVNNYPETLLFVINEREFRVPGMTTQPIDNVPSGTLNYEVISPTWGLRARRTTSLSGSETFTLTAQ